MACASGACQWGCHSVTRNISTAPPGADLAYTGARPEPDLSAQRSAVTSYSIANANAKCTYMLETSGQDSDLDYYFFSPPLPDPRRPSEPPVCFWRCGPRPAVPSWPPIPTPRFQARTPPCRCPPSPTNRLSQASPPSPA